MPGLHPFEPRAPMIVGWREHVGLPELGIPRLVCKVDTGARTSSLHAFAWERFVRDGVDHVRFGVHPRRRDEVTEVWCEAQVVGERTVTNTGGLAELRPLIRTALHLGDRVWTIEINLTDRSTMGYRMLLGRTAMRERLWVDPSVSYQQGRPRPLPENHP